MRDICKCKYFFGLFTTHSFTNSNLMALVPWFSFVFPNFWISLLFREWNSEFFLHDFWFPTCWLSAIWQIFCSQIEALPTPFEEFLYDFLKPLILLFLELNQGCYKSKVSNNNRFLRERGMASTLKMEYQVFLCIFQKNLAMATLGLNEMGKFLWEGREKSLPCWLSQFSKTKLRQPTGQTFFPTFPKKFSLFL